MHNNSDLKYWLCDVLVILNKENVWKVPCCFVLSNRHFAI